MRRKLETRKGFSEKQRKGTNGGGRWTWGMGENIPLLKGVYSRNGIQTDKEVSEQAEQFADWDF